MKTQSFAARAKIHACPRKIHRPQIDQLVAILKNSGAKTVFVFGSAAKGTLRDDSDVDLAVSGLPPENFFKALSTASNLSDRPVHLVDLDEVTPFTRYLIEEGELQRVG